MTNANVLTNTQYGKTEKKSKRLRRPKQGDWK